MVALLLDDARPTNGIPAMTANYTFMIKAKIVVAFASVIDLAVVSASVRLVLNAGLSVAAATDVHCSG